MLEFLFGETFPSELKLLCSGVEGGGCTWFGCSVFGCVVAVREGGFSPDYIQQEIIS